MFEICFNFFEISIFRSRISDLGFALRFSDFLNIFRFWRKKLGYLFKFSIFFYCTWTRWSAIYFVFHIFVAEIFHFYSWFCDGQRTTHGQHILAMCFRYYFCDYFRNWDTPPKSFFRSCKTTREVYHVKFLAQTDFWLRRYSSFNIQKIITKIVDIRQRRCPFYRIFSCQH